MHNVNYVIDTGNTTDILKTVANNLIYTGGRSDMKSLGHISGIECTTSADGTMGFKVDVQVIDENLQEWADDIVYKPSHSLKRLKQMYDPGRWMPSIRKVIFNDPATIIMWGDGTKTVVKAHNEKYDPEKGLAMAIAEKYYGNYSKFKKDIPTEEMLNG